MKKNKKMGRPRKAPALRKLYRWRPEQHKRLKEAVKKTGMKEAKFVVAAVMNEVNEVLEGQT